MPSPLQSLAFAAPRKAQNSTPLPPRRCSSNLFPVAGVVQWSNGRFPSCMLWIVMFCYRLGLPALRHRVSEKSGPNFLI